MQARADLPASRRRRLGLLGVILILALIGVVSAVSANHSATTGPGRLMIANFVPGTTPHQARSSVSRCSRGQVVGLVVPYAARKSAGLTVDIRTRKVYQSPASQRVAHCLRADAAVAAISTAG